MADNMSVQESVRTERVQALKERYEQCFKYALEHRTPITGSDPETGKPTVSKPVWEPNDFKDGPASEEFSDFELENPEHSNPTVAEALEKVTVLQISQSGKLHATYHDPAMQLTQSDIEAVTKWIDYVLDIAENLTDNQIQFFCDWYCWLKSGVHPYPNAVRKAGNLHTHKQFNTVLTITGRGDFPLLGGDAINARRDLALPPVTIEESHKLLEQAGKELAPTIETEKWEGRLDENGYLRIDLKVPDMSEHRRTNADGKLMDYHPAVHAKWTGWQPGDGGWEALNGWDTEEACWEDDKPIPVYEVDPYGLAMILHEMAVSIRYNERAKRAEMRALNGISDWTRRSLPSVWTNFDDMREDTLRLAIETCFASPEVSRSGEHRKWSPSDRRWRMLSNSLLNENRVDPFLEWLQTIKNCWDGQHRIETLLTRIGAPDTPLTWWASRYMLVGAIVRAYHPGSSLQEMPVLLGAQEQGKSGTIKMLIPTMHQHEWHGDALNLADNPQKQAEAIAGRVLIEVSEMVGSTRAEVEALKAFLTRTDDGQHRRAYAKYTESNPRRCVFVGTTNSSEPLPNDPTGNRRFVVIDLGANTPLVTGLEQVEWVEDNIEQLWGEAMWKYRHAKVADEHGNTYPEWGYANLPFDLKSEQMAVNEMYRHSDEMMENLVEKMAHQFRHGATLNELSSAIWGETSSMSGDRRNQSRLTRALRVSGWEKRRVRRDDGSRPSTWFPPEAGQASESAEPQPF